MDKTRNPCFILSVMESLYHTISQKVSDIFDLYTDLHGIRISIFGPEGRLLYPDAVGRPNSNHCSMLRDTLGMDSQCRKLDRKMMQMAFEQQGMISYTCHAGMREATAPLLVGRELVGFVMLGQFRSESAPAVSPYTKQWNAGQVKGALQREYAKTPVFPEDKIENLLSMFRHLLELIIGSQLIHHRDYDLLAPVIEHIHAHPEQNLSLAEAARMTGRSPSTVSRLFKKTTGRSFKPYQIWLRMERAAGLLESKPNRPVAEISESLGFDDPLYFSRMFRKHYGLSPRDYRQKHVPTDAR